MIQFARFGVRFILRARPCGSRVNPCSQNLNLGFRQPIRLIRRHQFARFMSRHECDQVTFCTVANDNRWLSGIAATQHRRTTIQPKMAFLSLEAMAFEAFCREDWSDLQFKADIFCRIGRPRYS